LKQFQETEPPYRLPDGLNVFSWSLPFLAEKVSSMLYTIVKKCSDYDDKQDNKDINIKDLIGVDLSELPKDEAK
jgi:serine/threonine-protein phosphatase 2B catalytic subunit